MKKTFMISFLLVAAINVFAQSTGQPTKIDKAGCRVDPDMPKNATPAWPASAYTPVEDQSGAPCYEYTNKHGLTIMECPFLVFPPTGDAAPGAVTLTETNDDINVQAENTYTGHYPACKRPTGMPKNATPVWPKSAYVPTGDPACPPCYEYTNKHGLTIMECPKLVFLPENKH